MVFSIQLSYATDILVRFNEKYCKDTYFPELASVGDFSLIYALF